MNERRLLRKINSKNNREGTSLGANTIDIVIEFLTQNKLIKPNLAKRLYNKLLRKESLVKTPQKIISDNFEKIINTFRDLSNDEKIDIGRVIEFCDTLIEREDTKAIGKDLIINNIDRIYPMIENGEDLFRLVQFEKSLDKEIDDSKENLLRSKKKEIAKYMLSHQDIHFSQEEKEEYAETLSIMIDELLESENCKYIDIIDFKNDSYSQVFQIGGKVLKVGGPRKTYEILNHIRLLQPLTRTNLLDREHNPKAYVEIQELVDPPGEVSDDELYEIYKELREDGIIWTDVKIPNIGRLKSNNIPTLNGREMDVAPNSVGFVNGKNKDNLAAGDLVVIDLDFIYREDDPNKEWIGHSEMFEKRYQQEKAEEVTKEYKEKQQENSNKSEQQRKEERH